MDRITNPDNAVDDRRWTEGDPETETLSTPLSAKYMNDLQEEICNVIEGFGAALDGDRQDQLFQILSDLSKAKTPRIDVITESSTWVKPAGAVVIDFHLIGGGGGGASGAVTAQGTTAVGGGGGGGGAYTFVSTDAADVPASCAVYIGTGGVGGAASATNSFNAGSRGVGTRVVGGEFQLIASGGDGAANSTGGMGGGSFGDGNSMFCGGKGGSGAGITGNNGWFVANGLIAGPRGGVGGGGGGGGISTSEFSYTGGRGASTAICGASGSSGVAGGANGHTPTTSQCYMGMSGGGAGANSEGDAGGGGNGANYGGAGGGGGASRTGFMSGKGGDGAPGVVVITSYF